VSYARVFTGEREGGLKINNKLLTDVTTLATHKIRLENKVGTFLLLSDTSNKIYLKKTLIIINLMGIKYDLIFNFPGLIYQN